MIKHFHVCQSIEGIEAIIMRLKKNHRKVEIPWLIVNNRPATLNEIQDAIREAKLKGYSVLPPCDNVTSDGHCAGHEEYEPL